MYPGASNFVLRHSFDIWISSLTLDPGPPDPLRPHIRRLQCRAGVLLPRRLDERPDPRVHHPVDLVLAEAARVLDADVFLLARARVLGHDVENAVGIDVETQELYAAVNLVRRVPPAPLLALLASQARFAHVGDLHFRLEDG